MAISWIGPAPKEARIAYTDGHIFNSVARATGREIPKGFPEKYTRDLTEVELFNATVASDVQEATRWHKRYLGDFGTEPLSIFEDYVRAGYVIFGTLLEHPPVSDARRFAACSVILQRGVIVVDPAPQGPGAAGPVGRALRETLFLRSYIHSAKDSKEFVNFVPRGGVQMAFASDTIWFPLELTRVIHEPASYVVLDILTRNALEGKHIPEPFRVEEEGHMTHDGRRYHVTRIGATLASKRKWPDLNIAFR